MQKEAVKTWLLQNAKAPIGMQYTHSWIVECLLLRNKSRRAYLHIRNHKILVPTLNNYLKKMKPSYDFCKEIFKRLQVKVAEMKP